MGQLAYIGASRPAFAPGPKTLTFQLVAGAETGDLLVLVAAYVNADSCPVPAGWTRAQHLVGTAVTIDVYVRQVDANEPATVVLVAALATSEWQGQLLALRGGAPGLIVQAAAINSYVAVATPNAPSVTPRQAVDLELCAWSTTGANVPVPPAPMTAIDGYASALATSRSFGIGFAICNATTALGTRGATGVNPSTGTAISIVLQYGLPIVPLTLQDPVPGNLGLRATPHTNIALRFDEPASALPGDEIGSLDDLENDSGAVDMPTLVTAWTGRGRAFDGADALLAHDTDDGNTLQQRDVTIRALIALDLATAAGATMTLICRGVSDGAPGEPYCYGLELQEQAAHPGFVELRWIWENSAGALVVEPAGVFQAPAAGVELAIAATRRWESSGVVVLRYYAGGELLGELVTAHGDIAGGTTGHTTVGARKDAGAWSHFFCGTIDELLVDHIEISPEELRQEHDRLVLHQAAGVEMLLGLSPPGAPWLAPAIAKLMKAAGQALGQPISMAEVFRALWLPDHAPLEQVIRWEAICELVPRPRDSLDVRRARIVTHLSSEESFSRPAVQALLATMLALSPDQVQIVEFSNTVRESFDTLNLERWLVAADAGAITIVAGALKIAVPATSDLRFEPQRVRVEIRTPLAAADGVVLSQVKLATYWAALPANTMVGLFLHNRVNLNSIWFGIGDVAGVRKIGYRLRVGGVQGAFVVLAASPDAAIWLRATRAAADVAGHFVLSYSVTGPSSGYTNVGVDTGITDVEWIGLAATSVDDVSLSTSIDLAATFDDLVFRAPNGDRPFYWFAYRDPALPNVADVDLLGADQVVQRIAPAHTVARAIASLSVIADDPVFGLADYGPAGAL